MTTINPAMTLGAVVTAHPDLARELERRGLDYCCHGRDRLADACRGAGLDPATVISELEAVAAPRTTEPWTELSPVALVDHIETVHHRYLWQELPRLGTLTDKVVAAHGTRHRELADVAALFAQLRADLEPHLTKEERVLFPMIRELVNAATAPTFHCGPIANPISVMMLEHDRAGELLTRLRAATHNYRVPADGCASYRACYQALAELEADTHLHIHKENNVLFPAVLQRPQRLRGDNHQDAP